MISAKGATKPFANSFRVLTPRILFPQGVALGSNLRTPSALCNKQRGETMTEIERIQDQLKRAFEANAWHGPSVSEVLNGITAEQAHARPLGNAHSIWELVRHIAVWEDVGRRRLSGDRAQIEISSPEDWPPPEDTSEAAWEQAKEALNRGHQALVEAIARTAESRLDEPIFEGMSTVYVTLHGVIQHDLYHAGQIAMLKKALN
jgi:uncharacterized damage-inducible protein DinB